MQILKFNNQFVDIDSETAIGLDIQTYDIKEPGERKVNNSNSFTIPVTSNNIKILGFANNPQSASSIIYDYLECDYWVDNHKLISGKARIEEIADRISVSMYDRNSIWDQLAEIPFRDEEPFTNLDSQKGLQHQILDWLQSEHGYPSQADPYTYDGSTTVKVGFDNFMWDYFNPDAETPGLVFTKGITNLSNVESDKPYVLHDFLEGFSNDYQITDRICTGYQGNIGEGDELYENIHGGNFSITVFTLFKFLEYKFPDVVWGTANRYEYAGGAQARYLYLDDADFELNTIFDKVYGSYEEDNFTFKNTLIPLRNIRIHAYTTGPSEYDKDVNIYFTAITCEPNFDTTPKFGAFYGTSTDNKYCDSKTAYDLVKQIFKQFNVLLDPIHYVDASTQMPSLTYFEMHFFNKLLESPIDQTFFTNLGRSVYKPYIDGWKQNNYITFDSIESSDKTVGAINIPCNNKTLELGGPNEPIYSIEAYTGNYTYYASVRKNIVVDQPGSLSDFYFVVKQSKRYFKPFQVRHYINTPICYYLDMTEERNEFIDLEKQCVFVANSMVNHTVTELIQNRPVTYKIEKFVTISELKRLKFYTRYWIRELNGYFYINKIEGFNPKSKSLTTFELIKIS